MGSDVDSKVVLCIAGSPRRGGNSDQLLAEAMRGATDAGHTVEHIVVEHLKFVGCTECGGCARDGHCHIADDMQQVYEKLDWADDVIIATPIFFMGLPGKLKSLIDRCQVYWSRRYVLKTSLGRKRPGGNGGLIAVGGTGFKNLFDGPRTVVKSLFHILDFKYTDELLLRKVDKQGDIQQHPEALKSAYQLGHDIAQTGPRCG